MPSSDTASSAAECVILRRSKMSARETMEFLTYAGGMCSEVIALSTGACLPLVGSGSTRQEISSGPPVQITFQQQYSSPPRKRGPGGEGGGKSRRPFTLNVHLDFNLVILDVQRRGTFFFLSFFSYKKIKYFLSLSDVNSSGLLESCGRGRDQRAAQPVGSRSECQSQHVYLPARVETKACETPHLFIARLMRRIGGEKRREENPEWRYEPPSRCVTAQLNRPETR